MALVGEDLSVVIIFISQKQSDVKALSLSDVAVTSWTRQPVEEEKLKSSAMMGNAVRQSPQFGSLIVAKESWWLLHHSDLWKLV